MNFDSKNDRIRILVVTAVEAEQTAVLRGLNGDNRFNCIVGGVGPVAAAISTTKALINNTYDLVMSVGIAGGFPNQVEVGSIVVASEIIAADLGAETKDGFCSLDELGFGSSRIVLDEKIVNKLSEAIIGANFPVKKGAILTSSTVTGTKETSLNLTNRIPEATAEAMEGFGVASAAHSIGLPVLEIRTISNPVGPRNRESWKIKEALEAVEHVSKVLTEVF